MPPSKAIHVVGCGAVTAVGASAPVAMAAVLAGISRMQLMPEDADADNGDLVSNVSRVTTLSIEEPAARARELLRLAIVQAMSPLRGKRAGALGAWTVGPAMLDARQEAIHVIAEKHRVVPLVAEAVGDHGSAALCAIERAVRKLAGEEIELALVAGFDVRTNEDAVAKAATEGRTIGPGRSWGYVPGEAAAAILLANERGLQRLALPSQSVLLAVATGKEPNPLGAASLCVGRGVTDAVRKALAVLPASERVARVICDLNGERARTDEWGFALPRVAGRLLDPGTFLAPATAWGDCGAPSGLLLLALALAIDRREGAKDSHTLVWTSSDGPERAAALVRTPLPAASRHSQGTESPHSPAAPAWAEELDREILSTMAEECSFRYGQRAYQLGALDSGEAAADWQHIERTEDCTDNLALGLAECGPRAHEIVRSAAPAGGPGAVYTAIRVFLEGDKSREGIELAVEYIADDPSLEPAVLAAFQHVLRPTEKPNAIAADLFSAGPALSWLALQLAVSVGATVPVAQLHELAANISPERVLPFIRALGRSGDASAQVLLSRWFNSSDAMVRREAALADILLGPDDPGACALQSFPYDDAMLLPAALVIDARRAPQLLARAKASQGPEPILTMAIVGEPTAVPWLLERIEDEATGAMAACALEILLGASLFENIDAPDEDASAKARKIRRVSRNRADWAQVAEQVLAARHPKNQRLQAGAPATAMTTVTLLERAHLPPLARRYLGYELTVRWKSSPIFDSTAFLRVQHQEIARVRAKCVAPAPKSIG